MTTPIPPQTTFPQERQSPTDRGVSPAKVQTLPPPPSSRQTRTPHAPKEQLRPKIIQSGSNARRGRLCRSSLRNVSVVMSPRHSTACYLKVGRRNFK
ncbi:hypothetical protein LSTR_LSTR001411 [Laodelphax striatellus]|uniref:Uncharacterized protein n=1 Tax=Laodelphax striatellus TaxID=195883 RepID=A0A482XA53_LAOST|nr:hypothetical protein LSTR_LSTR001411 [Laodelphax striatellus]